MHEQLSLFETPQPRRPSYGLVLAVFPDQHSTWQIENLGNSLRERHRMSGRMRPTSHLHVSVPFPSRAADVLETVVQNIDRVCNAATAVTRPFAITFDRVMSFRGGLGNHPLVLVDDNQGNDGLRSLYGLLCDEFAKNISARFSIPKFSPHLTLLYDKQQLAPLRVEPVRWTVKEIVLVLSEVGATKYHRLGCWAFSEQA